MRAGYYGSTEKAALLAGDGQKSVRRMRDTGAEVHNHSRLPWDAATLPTQPPALCASDPVCVLPFCAAAPGLFGSVMGILTVFGAEKAVFQREYGNRMYGLPAYFISRYVAPCTVAIRDAACRMHPAAETGRRACALLTTCHS